MARYVVIRPWFGVKLNQQVEIENLHPALASNVRLITQEADSGQDFSETLPDGGFPPAGQPESGSFDWETVRAALIEELDDSVIEYEPDAPAAELAMLLEEDVREGIKLGAAE